MGRGLYPDELSQSAYTVDYERLYQEGYRGIIYDIDNTLVLPDAPADARARELLARLHAIGYRTVVLSNNKGPRVSSFAQEAGTLYVSGGGKPLPGGYRRAMSLMETDAGNTLFIGDQIFTDIWGANGCGLHTILTEPFTKKEEIQIVMKRVLEKPVLALYKASRKTLMARK